MTTENLGRAVMDILANYAIVNRKFCEAIRWPVNNPSRSLARACSAALNRSLLAPASSYVGWNADRQMPGDRRRSQHRSRCRNL